MVGVAGCLNGQLLWQCGHSELYLVAAAGVLLLSRGSVCGAGVSGGGLASVVLLGSL